MSEFFDNCRIVTSNFDRAFAEQDKDWNLVSKLKGSGQIPQLIHFIWLGGPLPKVYEKNIMEWAKTGIPCKIWTDKNTKDLEMVNRDLFDKSTNMGGKSDILRLEVLRTYGGFYIDTDYILVNSSKFIDIFRSCDFFGCTLYDREVAINNGCIGSRPNHPIIVETIKNCTLDNPWGIQCPQTLLHYQAGNKLLTKYVLKHADEHTRIDPTTSFHPFPPSFRNEATEQLVNSFIRSETIAVHLWRSSYSPKSMFYEGN